MKINKACPEVLVGDTGRIGVVIPESDITISFLLPERADPAACLEFFGKIFGPQAVLLDSTPGGPDVEEIIIDTENDSEGFPPW